MLTRAGFKVDRQRSIDIDYDGMHFPAAFRVDLMIDDQLIVEIKTVERLAPIHAKQLLTYLRLTDQPVGLVLNFSCETKKEGIRRVVNSHRRQFLLLCDLCASARANLSGEYRHGTPHV